MNTIFDFVAKTRPLRRFKISKYTLPIVSIINICLIVSDVTYHRQSCETKLMIIIFSRFHILNNDDAQINERSSNQKCMVILGVEYFLPAVCPPTERFIEHSIIPSRVLPSRGKNQLLSYYLSLSSAASHLSFFISIMYYSCGEL